MTKMPDYRAFAAAAQAASTSDRAADLAQWFATAIGDKPDVATAARLLDHNLIDSMGVAVYTTGADGRLTFYNTAASDLWGWQPPLNEQVWCGSWRIYAPDGSFMPHDSCPMATCLKERRPVRGAWAFAERPDGSRVPFAPFPTPLLDEAGNLIGAINVLVDISGVRSAEDKWATSEARFRAAQEVSPDGFVVLEAQRSRRGRIADFKVAYANPAAQRLLRRLGVTDAITDTMMASALPKIWDGGAAELLADFSKVMAHGLPSEHVYCLAVDAKAAAQGKGGRWFRTRTVVLADGVAVSFEDISVRRRAECRARYLAEHDELTGLVNRRGFHSLLNAAIAAEREQPHREFALLMIDLDRFKSVNDTLGHPAGDLLLRVVASRLTDIVGTADHVGRLSGDEFAVLHTVRNNSPDSASTLAQSIIEALAAPFDINGQQIRTAASLGIATAAASSLNPRELLKNSDLALYRAKQAGRGRYAVYEAGLDSDALRRQRLELDLRRALAAGGELENFYQPIFDAKTRTLVGMEALARWRHPEMGLIGPEEFVRVAEDIGLVGLMGELLLRMACHEAAIWPDHIRVSVNLSPAQLRQPMFLETVNEALSDSGLAPERLELEVTEALMLEDVAMVRNTLDALRALGVSIALDDFGTGYSSLSYLHMLPFDRLKIDRSFTHNATSSVRSEAILRAITTLAAELGMVVTAEGIETEIEMALVAGAGCREIQGYLLGKPTAADAARHYIRANSHLLID